MLGDVDIEESGGSEHLVAETLVRNRLRRMEL